MIFEFFQNIDLLAVGIAVAAIGILGFVIYFNRPKSATARAFLLFSIITIFWSGANYFQPNVLNPILSFWLVRLVIFLAVWHAFSIFNLFYVFPKDKADFSKNYKRFLLPIVVLASFVTLTPLVFESIAEVDLDGRIVQINNGPAIALFTTVVVSLIFAALYILIKKTIQAEGKEKKQFSWILTGTLATFALLLIFNFILPAFFKNPDYIPLGPVFILPFAVFTFYAISQHNLLDIKVVSTEIIAFFLALAAFLQIMIASSAAAMLFQAFVFILLLIFSIFLIKSVIREVRQREELEKLTGELSSANAKLKKLDQLKSDFLSFATHQLRAPLTVAKGYISMILEGSYGPVSDMIAEKLKRVYDSSGRLIKLVEDFLNLSRIEQGRMKYDFKPASLDDIADEVARELAESAKSKKLELIWKRPLPPLPDIAMDASKMREVVYNLVDNAVKYAKSGRIEIKTEKAGKFLKLSVKDTGIGILPEDIKNLFQKFSRIDSGYQFNVHGQGIGLYVARQIVEAHGGKIWAESEGLYKGSIFYVELPIK